MSAITLATVASIASIAAAGATVVKSFTADKPKAPKMPEAVKPPIESKTPDADVFRAKNQQQMGGQGALSTLLTGAGGVAPGSLSLGRNTLLGG